MSLETVAFLFVFTKSLRRSRTSGSKDSISQTWSDESLILLVELDFFSADITRLGRLVDTLFLAKLSFLGSPSTDALGLKVTYDAHLSTQGGDFCIYFFICLSLLNRRLWFRW